MNRNVPGQQAEIQATVTPLLPTGRWSLEQAQQYLQVNLDEGISCPCCGQYARTYRRKLYGTQARTLIYAARKFGAEFFHLSKLDGQKPGVRQADFPKLAYWDLLEKAPADPHWRITDKGFSFASNKIKVPETVVLYDSRLQGFEGRLVTIADVLPANFDPRTMM